ncbi:MAG TPA: hypothetical protein VLS96_02750, partial [Nodosilinea sp.]|nr:hypothetical protein [Nodosilinea sp.]
SLDPFPSGRLKSPPLKGFGAGKRQNEGWSRKLFLKISPPTHRIWRNPYENNGSGSGLLFAMSSD